MLSGYVHPDVRGAVDVLQRQIARNGGGAALSIVHRGAVVVDVWGGVRDDSGAPWTRDTVALSFSTTKGVASTLLHVLASQGRVDYDAPVARYWPAFAHGGKRDVTVRNLLAHEAGLWPIRDLVEDASDMRDWSGMLERMERATPVHTPGARNGYHGLTFAWLVGGLVEKVTGRPFARVLEEELTGPLSLDGCYVGLPAHCVSRRATLLGLRTSRPRRPRRRPVRERLFEAAWRSAHRLARSDPENLRRALLPRGIRRFDWNALETVQACIPSASGMFTARALARVYAMIAEGGALDSVRLLSPEVVEQASAVQNRRFDDVLLFPTHWRLGYHRVTSFPRGFGHFGFGGSGAWCDPSQRLAVAMTLNSGVGTPLGDLRMWQVNRGIVRALARR